MQDDDYADDPVLEAYLQVLAVDKSKVKASHSRASGPGKVTYCCMHAHAPRYHMNPVQLNLGMHIQETGIRGKLPVNAAHPVCTDV